MKKILCLCGVFASIAMLFVGLATRHAYADDECLDPQSSLRGSWSFSQVTEILPGLSNLPATAVGVIKIDACGRFQGSATLNIPCPDQACFGLGNPLPAPLAGQIIAGEDGTAVSSGEVLGTPFHRACVMMEKRGDCFQEFHCVSSDPAPNDAQLSIFKRQVFGSCR